MECDLPISLGGAGTGRFIKDEVWYMERIPKPGEFYRHFKDKLYQIITIAVHSETGEPMVVYQALYGDFQVYVRPLDLFVSPVDRDKYPDAKQEYRFEPVTMHREHQGSETNKADEDGRTGAEPEQNKLNPLVVSFVEAERYEQKLSLLAAMRESIGQEELDVLYLSLDLPRRAGTVEKQLGALEQYLRMQMHFDGRRLR